MTEKHFTDSTFKTDVLESKIPVFVDFWAPWCGPCQMMGPLVEELAGEIDASKLVIGKLNVDENSDSASVYQVMSIPTFLIFKNGQVVDKLVGGVSKEKIREFMMRNIA